MCQVYEPIVLPVENRLVLSPHTYGHFNFGYIRYDPSFPLNLPGVCTVARGSNAMLFLAHGLRMPPFPVAHEAV